MIDNAGLPGVDQQRSHMEGQTTGRSVKVEMLDMPRAKWEIIRDKILTDLARQKPSGWLSGALALVGISATAFVGYFTLPDVATKVHAGADGIVLTIAIASAVGAGICFTGHFGRKSDIHKLAHSICRDLDVELNYSTPQIIPEVPRGWKWLRWKIGERLERLAKLVYRG